MTVRFSFLRDTRHLQVLFLLLLTGGVCVAFVRAQLVPESYGQHGSYRGEALNELAALPHVLTSDTACLKCHEKIQEERAESPHTAVRCMHCHGNGHAHMAQALTAAASPDATLDPAKPWDGKHLSSVDLFITRDRAICLSCHQKVVGMPKDFRAIDVNMHLEEQGAENREGADVCFECHTGHSPGI